MNLSNLFFNTLNKVDKRMAKIIFNTLLLIALISTFAIYKFLISLPDKLHLRNNVVDFLYHYNFIVYGILVIKISGIIYHHAKKKTALTILGYSILGLTLVCSILCICLIISIGPALSIEDEEIAVYDDGIVMTRQYDWRGDTLGYRYLKINHKIFLKELTDEEYKKAEIDHGDLTELKKNRS